MSLVVWIKKTTVNERRVKANENKDPGEMEKKHTIKWFKTTKFTKIWGHRPRRKEEAPGMSKGLEATGNKSLLINSKTEMSKFLEI